MPLGSVAVNVFYLFMSQPHYYICSYATLLTASVVILTHSVQFNYVYLLHKTHHHMLHVCSICVLSGCVMWVCYVGVLCGCTFSFIVISYPTFVQNSVIHLFV